jgi:hypothetical protein
MTLHWAYYQVAKQPYFKKKKVAKQPRTHVSIASKPMVTHPLETRWRAHQGINVSFAVFEEIATW